MKFAKKSLGQNFLTDLNIIKKIINLTETFNKDIIEIGPGKGALTDQILKNKPKSLTLIEKDYKLSNELKALQMNVVESIYKNHLKSKKSHFEGDFKLLNDKYGYPFIGNHWIPHITIGSMDINPEKLLEYSKKLLDLPKEITINNLGLFKIEGDSHQLIKKIEF